MQKRFLASTQHGPVQEGLQALQPCHAEAHLGTRLIIQDVTRFVCLTQTSNARLLLPLLLL